MESREAGRLAALGEVGRLALSRAGAGASIAPALEVLRAALAVPAVVLCEHQAEADRLVVRAQAGAPALARERLPAVDGPLAAAIFEDGPAARSAAAGDALHARGLGRCVAAHVPAPGERPPWGVLAALGGDGLALAPAELALLGQAARLLGAALGGGGPLDPDGGRTATDRGRLVSVSRFAAAVVHELNNLSMSVNGHAQLARRRTAEGDPIRRDLGQVLDAARHAGDLARRLHPAMAGVGAPPRTALDGVAAAAVESTAPLPGARVTLRAGAPGATVEAEPARLAEVVQGLIRNARAASADDGEVVVETALLELGPGDLEGSIGALRPGRHARLRVTDRGPGLPPDPLAHAFEPYGGRGMRKGGFGLWAAYHLATSSNGGLRLRTEPGETVVELLLPCQAPPGATRVVLLVTGSALLARIVRAWLTTAGATVVVARGADEALARVAAGGVEQALVDAAGDDGDGRALAARLGAGLPFGAVVVAGSPAQGELGRPFTPARLVALLRLR